MLIGLTIYGYYYADVCVALCISRLRFIWAVVCCNSIAKFYIRNVNFADFLSPNTIYFPRCTIISCTNVFCYEIKFLWKEFFSRLFEKLAIVVLCAQHRYRQHHTHTHSHSHSYSLSYAIMVWKPEDIPRVLSISLCCTLCTSLKKFFHHLKIA